MITESDLKQAIAECQGERNPNANTCMKLAAYYTILNNLYPANVAEKSMYSYAPAPASETVDYYSDSEFAQLIDGKSAVAVWSLIDELMSTLQAIQPRLYDGVIRKLREIQ